MQFWSFMMDEATHVNGSTNTNVPVVDDRDAHALNDFYLFLLVTT